MSNLTEWWEGLTFPLKIYWGLAIPFTFLFLLQVIWSFIGGDDFTDDNPDAVIDADHGVPFQFFTLKNLIAFFTLFGWAGVASIDSGLSQVASAIVAVAAGLAMMTATASVLYLLGKANADGTLRMNNAIGVQGEVYLIIYKTRTGMGKVQIRIQGALRTLDAITDDDADIPSGKIIRVKDVVSNSILLVTAI